MTPVATETITAERLINEAEQANPTNQMNDTDPATDSTGNTTATASATPKPPRWSETNHVFAQPHPAHELIASQTAYGRDIKDEAGNITEKRPEGFDRVMLPNLVPSGLLAEAERLCSMHNVDLRDEWRFAMLQMTQALINDLTQRPVPADYKGETRRLTDAEREAKRAAAESHKAEAEKLREAGKLIREEQKAEIERIQAEFKAKMEAAGIKVPERSGRKKTAPANPAIPTADAPLTDAPVPTPVTLVHPSGTATAQANGTETNGTETQEAATQRIEAENAAPAIETPAPETASKSKTGKK